MSNRIVTHESRRLARSRQPDAGIAGSVRALEALARQEAARAARGGPGPTGHDPRAGALNAKLRINARGIYEIAWVEPDGHGRPHGRTLSTRSKDFRTASEALTEFLSQEHTHVRKGVSPLVSTLCDYYMAHRGGQRHKSVERIVRKVAEWFGEYQVDQLNQSVFSAFERAAGGKDGSRRRWLGQLRTVLIYTQKHGQWDGKIPHIDLPPTSEPRVKFLTDKQERAFWSAAEAWGRLSDNNQRLAVWLTVAIGLETAARRGAIESLTWDRVDFENRVIDFRIPGSRITRKRRVGVRMSKRLFPVLKEEWDRRTHDKARVIPPGDHKLGFRTFTRSIGMEWVTPHVMRHTWATMAARDGVSLPKIAAVLGDGVKTVERNYIHFVPDDLRDVMDRRDFG